MTSRTERRYVEMMEIDNAIQYPYMNNWSVDLS